MRYTPGKKLMAGMTVGQDICNGEGRLIVKEHQRLEEEDLQELAKWGIPGAYIEDVFTEDIQIVRNVSSQVRCRALKMIHDLFKTDVKNPTSQEKMQHVVADMIQDVMNHKDALYDVLDIRTGDDYTYFHCVNVAVLAAVIGIGSGMSRYDMVKLTTAAILHDVGKRFVDSDVLNAKRGLLEEERIMIMQHPKLGFEFLKDHYEFSSDVYISVLQHHEWFNGQGYPLRYSGSDIPLYARIVKLADVYDALTSKRPYHEAISPLEAFEYMEENSGVEFDPELVDIFKRKVTPYPSGCEVCLSDGRIAVVMENDADAMLRPKVKVIPTGEIINLKDDMEESVTITELLL